MADNMDVTPGTGKTVAADEIAGVLFQRIKIVVGADGINGGDVSSSNRLPVDTGLTPQTDALTDTQLRATPVPVSVSGGATSAKQDTGNASVSSIDTKLSSQATASKQDTGNTSVGNLDTNLGAKADSAASTDTGTFSLIALIKRALQALTTIGSNTTGVSTAANQSTANTSLSTIATNTGNGATSANQATANSSLSTIATNTGNGATSANQTNGNQQVQGNVASASADSGNPVKVGGKFNSSVPTIVDGVRSDLQVNSKGSLRVIFTNGNSDMSFGADNVDGAVVSATAVKAQLIGRQTVFNGASWDRMYGTTRGVFNEIRDAAGNARGANVDANNNLMVNVAAGLAPAATALNTYAAHITTNTTTTPTSSLAYISSIVISIDVIATTAGTLTIKDKSGTPLIIVNGLNTTAAVSTTPTVINFQTPIKVTGGIDIVTAASVGAATLDVWINYYQ
jgi:hypothetical protein